MRYYSLLFLALLIQLSVVGQFNEKYKKASEDLDSLLSKCMIESLRFHLPNIQSGNSVFKTNSDSATAVNEVSSTMIKRKSNLLDFKNGYVSYLFSKRSGTDSIYNEDGVSQHLVSSSFALIVDNSIPINVMVFGRESNSHYIKNFRSIRVALDVPEYHKLKIQKSALVLEKQARSLEDPLLKLYSRLANQNFSKVKDFINDPLTIRKVIDSKEILGRNDFKDTIATIKDSLKTDALNFLKFYDSLTVLGISYQNICDSFNTYIESEENNLSNIKRLSKNPHVSENDLTQFKKAFKNKKYFKHFLSSYESITSISIGNSSPEYSLLTVANTSITGVNTEYNKSNIYLATTFGKINDFISDSWFQKQKTEKESVIAFRIGYGRLVHNNLILTYYQGKKRMQYYDLKNLSPIKGISLRAQYYLNKSIKLFGEVGQSSILDQPGGHSKNRFDFKDHTQQGYDFGIQGYIPRSSTKFNGYYKYTGLNHQDFTGYKFNASTNAWSIDLLQSLWNRQMVLTASVKKNDYYNPEVLQHFNSKTVFKSFVLNIRKKFWPSISIGYLPSSQNTIINNILFENRYQLFNAIGDYHYSIGQAKASTVFSYNQLYNNKTDSVFIYYNSKNYYLNQSFYNERYTSHAGISINKSLKYTLSVIEGGWAYTLNKNFNAGLDIKINSLNLGSVKTGYKGEANIAFPKIGNLNFCFERTYLQDNHNSLKQFDFINVGFTRYL